jgi:hypothetical protein
MSIICRDSISIAHKKFLVGDTETCKFDTSSTLFSYVKVKYLIFETNVWRWEKHKKGGW